MSNFGLKNIIGIIVGIGIIVINVMNFINKEALMQNGLETTAIVTEISTRGKNRSISTKVYVKYTVDDVFYNNHLSIQNYGRYIGEEIAILYNPNNPNTITPRDRSIATDDTVSLAWSSGAGVILILLSISLGRNNVKKVKREWK
ncbi:DUF3592 domain-containing protein [Anaerosporobacter sp.]|uniref:DUF3592 domain-containing protein n=1 Tax=Anaerosporobacter sp. TaxID=1872529 RepID=UPI00286ECD2C|nr:DUF3592 domain-containing protein [Anaerosporobacter sp.]